MFSLNNKQMKYISYTIIIIILIIILINTFLTKLNNDYNNKIFENPWLAYDNYENVGVTKIKNGQAIIKLHLPNGYKVGMGKEIKPHFHYRICCNKNIMLSQVYTVYI